MALELQWCLQSFNKIVPVYIIIILYIYILVYVYQHPVL